MSTSNLFRLSALAAFTSAVCMFVGHLLALLPNPQPGLIIVFFSPIAGLWAITGIYLWQREKAGVFGGIGYIVSFFGLALIVGLVFASTFIIPRLGENVVEGLMTGPAGMIFMVSAIIYLVGIILFGISIIVAGVFSWIPALLLMIGFVPATLFTLFPPIVGTIGHVVAAVAIFWFGVSLWSFSVKRVG